MVVFLYIIISCRLFITSVNYLHILTTNSFHPLYQNNSIPDVMLPAPREPMAMHVWKNVPVNIVTGVKTQPATM
jgi:hypothetical protein